ncbi:PriCT-2 domain-containing protein [Paludibacteraceae bacterium OttesenSCG-928-F17]|nr:PriCT-2 domain-containing protein [Paludibacteraceae bacterium OttesenSCG-928-F17]
MNTYNILNVEVSCFENYRSITPQAVNLLKFLTDNKHAAEVEKIRSTDNKKERNTLKSNLPCITPSGLFRQREEKGLIQHSRLICIDIDAKDNPDISMPDLKKELCNIVNIAFCAYSVSGKGLFCLIPIASPEKHRQHFDALVSDFKSFDINLDKTCKNKSRLRGYSYDPQAYINHEAIVYEKTIEKSNKNRSLKMPTNKNDDRLKVLIQKVAEAGIDICPSYDEWFAVGCALSNSYGEQGREYFHLISRNYPNYDPKECDNQYSNILKQNKQGYTENTIFEYAKRHNITLK